MNQTLLKGKKILFLFSDAGGGHRSAAEAIIEAIHSEYGDLISIEMVDILKQYGPSVINRLPDWYPWMVRNRSTWKLFFQLTNDQGRVQAGMRLIWPYIKGHVVRMLQEHPCDLFVSVHPGANDALLRLMGDHHPPFISVVTELTNVHSVWYHQGVDLCIVPTGEALEGAIASGLNPEKVRLVGLPVAKRFCHHPGDRLDLRRNLGWSQDQLIVLLVGGGEGMGPIEATARAIASLGLPIELVVVTGRNHKLRQRLENSIWDIPVRIYGFVENMPDFMCASDILVTKGGPGSVSEALNAGLPIIIYTFIPGQEEGNIQFIVDHGAGIYAPFPEQVVNTIRDWLTNPVLRQRFAKASRELGNPDAARQIAHILAGYLQPIASNSKLDVS